MKFAKAIFACAAIAMTATSAQAACWSAKSASAAQVREFETMLMVSALRCRSGSDGFLDDYNRFVRSSRTTLTGVNDDLRAQFGGNSRSALNRYDSYVTSIANRHGAGSAGLDCGDMKKLARDAVAAKGSRATLDQLAVRAGADPELPGGRCRGSVTVATRR